MQSTASSTGCRNKGCFVLWGFSALFLLSTCALPLSVSLLCQSVVSLSPSSQSPSPRLRVACVSPRLRLSASRLGFPSQKNPLRAVSGRSMGDEQPQLTADWLGWGGEPNRSAGRETRGCTTWRTVRRCTTWLVVRSWSLFPAM